RSRCCLSGPYDRAGGDHSQARAGRGRIAGDRSGPPSPRALGPLGEFWAASPFIPPDAEEPSMNLLDQLRTMTVVVAATAAFEPSPQQQPRDGPTDPSLLLKAAQMPAFRALPDAVIGSARSESGAPDSPIGACVDRLFVAFGEEILKIIPGRVSTEVDARL